MIEPIVIHKHVEGDRSRLIVDSWPREVVFDDVLLKNADPAIMALDGGTVTIRVDNGQAVYELGDLSVFTLARPGYLVSSRLTS